MHQLQDSEGDFHHVTGVCGSDRFVKRLGTVVGDDFLNIVINCVRPVIFHVGEIAIVRFLGSVPIQIMLGLEDISIDPLEPFQVPFPWSRPEPGHGGDLCMDIKPPQGN